MDAICLGLQSGPDQVSPAKFHSQIPRTRLQQPDSGEIPLYLSLSISLAPHFLSPVLDFFDRGILCHELSMFHDSGMVMGDWRS